MKAMFCYAILLSLGMQWSANASTFAIPDISEPPSAEVNFVQTFSCPSGDQVQLLIVEHARLKRPVVRSEIIAIRVPGDERNQNAAVVKELNREIGKDAIESVYLTCGTDTDSRSLVIEVWDLNTDDPDDKIYFALDVDQLGAVKFPE